MFRRMTRERYLSDDELERFMAAVRSRRHVHQRRDHAFFALLANSGLRPSEALALTVADLHLSDNPPWVRVVRLKKKKTVRETDDLQIPHEVAVLLAAHVEGRPGDSRPFPISRRAASRLFHGYARQASVRNGWLYILRHTAATRIYRATRDIAVVQAVLGHESPDTSAIYAHVSRDMLHEVAKTFPAVV
jgi:integrase